MRIISRIDIISNPDIYRDNPVGNTPVAQLVEQLILNQRVARSIRAGRTFINNLELLISEFTIRHSQFYN